MPKVLRILNRFNLGGPTLNAALLTKYLAPEFETMLIGGKHSGSEKNSEYILENMGIDYRTIEEMQRPLDIYNDIKAYRKIKQIIREFKPDIVHTHAAKAGALGRYAASFCKVPVIIHTFHGHVFDAYFNSIQSDFYKNVERFLAAKSTRIIAVSENQKHELADIHKICAPEKIEVISLGLSLEKFKIDKEDKRIAFRKKYNLSEDEIAIGIIGRLVPIKNHELFLKSIKFVKEKSHKKIRAFIVGDGETKEHLKSFSTQLDLDFLNTDGIPRNNEKTTVTFTSWIKEVDNVLAGLDIVCLTSLNEGTPVSLIEAQAAGKPIVSTEVGGIKNVVIENKTALLTPNNDAQAFSDALFRVVEDDELRKSLSVEGAKFVENKYDYKRLCSDMRNLYNKLLEK
ncbi:MAG: glycosyltransferase [Bacteroidales bacterium]|nr:glycosyltransferase [Bacteroidales bacterium]